MFDALSRCQVPPGQEVDAKVLRRMADQGDGFHLWFARKVAWPFQQIPFELTVGSPRTLSVMERILLYILMAMPDTPPDSQTIARELAIEDAFFIEETFRDLAALGAVQNDSTGRLRITDLGRTCHGMGHLPTQPRRLTVSVFFDPLAGDFPDNSVLPEGLQDWADHASAPVLDPSFAPADPRRIPLDTLRQVLSRQCLLPSGGNPVVYAAEAACLGHVQCDPQEGSSPALSQEGIRWRDLCLLVFLNGEGQAKLCVYDPHLRSSPRWFQQVLDNRLSEGPLDWNQILESLAEPATSSQAGRSVSLQYSEGTVALEPVSSFAVHKEVLEAVAQSKERLLLHSQALPNGASGSLLCKSIQRAARRGVRCQLSWGADLVVDLAEAAKAVGPHDNIEHRANGSLDQELLWVDQPVVLSSCICRISSRAQACSTAVLRVGRSADAGACRTVCSVFDQAWQHSQPAFEEEFAAQSLAVPPAVGGQLPGGVAVPYSPVSIPQSRREAS